MRMLIVAGLAGARMEPLAKGSSVLPNLLSQELYYFCNFIFQMQIMVLRFFSIGTEFTGAVKLDLFLIEKYLSEAVEYRSLLFSEDVYYI